MNVELPFAPVDTIIRRNAGSLRVSADAAEALAKHIQRTGAELAKDAAQKADADNRNTIMARDFGDNNIPGKASLVLPLAPVDRIARLDIDDRFRVSEDARIALASKLEGFADDVAVAAATLARHGDRRTIQSEDIETYFELLE
jgi:histone H3/H4